MSKLMGQHLWNKIRELMDGHGFIDAERISIHFEDGSALEYRFEPELLIHSDGGKCPNPSECDDPDREFLTTT